MRQNSLRCAEGESHLEQIAAAQRTQADIPGLVLRLQPDDLVEQLRTAMGEGTFVGNNLQRQ